MRPSCDVVQPNTVTPSASSASVRAALVCFGHLSPPAPSPISRGVDDELETERSQVLFCEECGCDSDDEARGWEGHLAWEDDGSTTVVIFCPACSVEV